jgi:hypothetical protein
VRTLPAQTETITLRLAALEADRDAMLKLWKSVIGPANSPMFPLDLLASAAVKRNISAASALRLLVGSWNMACARSLLRTHIDTALRFSAAWLVDEPHTLATQMIAGERLDKMKDRDGKRLTDAHLVQMREDEYPWLPAVYKNLSGYCQGEPNFPQLWEAKIPHPVMLQPPPDGRDRPSISLSIGTNCRGNSV